jgi:hypothetical protein
LGGRIDGYRGGTIDGRESMAGAVGRNVTMTNDGSEDCVADRLLQLHEALLLTSDDDLRAGRIAR